jgi:5-hydroxyisourate hydrolase
MSAITTHVLDAVLGKPAAGIQVHLERGDNGVWTPIGSGQTDADGRCRGLAPEGVAGSYRLTFFISAYLTERGRSSLYQEIAISFVCDGEADYHLPVLLSDNSYTTYRGS